VLGLPQAERAQLTRWSEDHPARDTTLDRFAGTRSP
jgi:hypothetical protein